MYTATEYHQKSLIWQFLWPNLNIDGLNKNGIKIIERFFLTTWQFFSTSFNCSSSIPRVISRDKNRMTWNLYGTTNIENKINLKIFRWCFNYFNLTCMYSQLTLRSDLGLISDYFCGFWIFLTIWVQIHIYIFWISL